MMRMGTMNTIQINDLKTQLALILKDDIWVSQRNSLPIGAANACEYKLIGIARGDISM
jgi:hypothetical protein